jgi:hypothetical protein
MMGMFKVDVVRLQVTLVTPAVASSFIAPGGVCITAVYVIFCALPHSAWFSGMIVHSAVYTCMFLEFGYFSSSIAATSSTGAMATVTISCTSVYSHTGGYISNFFC